MQKTPSKDEILKVLGDAQEAADNAASARTRLRRRRTPRRRIELEEARDACAEAAKPLRKLIGMSVQHDFSAALDVKLKKAMAGLRKEREQLRKML
jgi:hypothetical protein